MASAYLGWASISSHAIYEDGKWKKTECAPNISPASMGLQFGQSVIEGMKAYLDDSDLSIHVFRCRDHFQRLVSSCLQIGLPSIPQSLFYTSLLEVLSNQSQWKQPLPSNEIYIRPIVYALDDHMFPIRGHRYGFSLFVAPVGSFQKSYNYTLRIQNKFIRTTNDGLGNAKASCNYAPLFAAREIQQDADSLLWLSSVGVDAEIDEASTANIFFVSKELSLMTPSLNGRILTGITRKSILQIAQALKIPIEEKPIKLAELHKELDEKKIISCFLTSTACGIQAVHSLIFESDSWNFHEHSIIKELKEVYNSCLLNKNSTFSEWSEQIGHIGQPSQY
ncbi:aminotransferase class IV [Nostoc commune]|uniref:aminotransferase class IV n=1 Tax=Nostoc commune TaxID=1178 RepID=UPI0018C71B23|nr:aminotransferase class IV [Nostoc commune]MBG1262381.1 hypothetical protein [Nostoc commune BAE]